MYIGYVHDTYSCGYKYFTRLCDNEEEVKKCVIAIINNEHNHDEEDLTKMTFEEILEEFQFSYIVVKLDPNEDYTYIPR